jgi:hypothetical protein
MNHDPSDGHSSGTNLQRTGQDVPTRIENPQDLLGEALRRLSPEKTQEILGTAAQAALEIQIKQKEAELDIYLSSRRLDQTAAAARQLSEAEAFKLEDEHKSAHGYTRVTVSKEKSQPKRGFLSWLLGRCLCDYGAARRTIGFTTAGPGSRGEPFPQVLQGWTFTMTKMCVWGWQVQELVDGSASSWDTPLRCPSRADKRWA